MENFKIVRSTAQQPLLIKKNILYGMKIKMRYRLVNLPVILYFPTRGRNYKHLLYEIKNGKKFYKAKKCCTNNRPTITNRDLSPAFAMLHI